MQKMKKALYFISGSLALAIGIIGIFLPLIPTTGPLILASFCFTQSSKRMHTWLLEHRILGPPIQRYLAERAMTLRSKVLAISSIWLGISSSSILFVDNLYLRIALLLLCVILSTYILRLKTAAAPVKLPKKTKKTG